MECQGAEAPQSNLPDVLEEERVDLPFFPECEVFEGDCSVDQAKQVFNACEKNPGHKDFFHVDKLTIDDLPEGCRSEKNVETIRNCSDRTLKLRVSYTSEHRPCTYPYSGCRYPYSEYRGSDKIVRCGTGVIFFVSPNKIVDKYCPCHPCKRSGTPRKEYFEVLVFTASHVVFDDLEASRTICEVFYDSESRQNVRCLYGVKGVANGSGGECYEDDENNWASLAERCTTDKFFIQCVNHDMELFEKLRSTMSGNHSQFYGVSPLKFVISHPHGCSKRITFGKVLHYVIPLPVNYSPDYPCIIAANAECITENSADISPCDSDIVEEIFMIDVEDYKTYRLKINLKVCLPPNAPFLLRCDATKDDFCWMSFPENTEFTSLSGKRTFCLTGVKFFLPKLGSGMFREKYVTFYMTYDIPTCSGSSGAQVVADDDHVYTLDWATHCGSLTNGSRENRSGYNRHHYDPNGCPPAGHKCCVM